MRNATNVYMLISHLELYIYRSLNNIENELAAHRLCLYRMVLTTKLSFL
jgi:hypothetical protein